RDWWREMGPEGTAGFDVYLRTAISVEQDGWAHFDYVKMPDYRWGIFLNPAEPGRKVHFGAHKGEDAWQEVPGEYRANLRRIIVTQGDTEPASVEQQRHLGMTAPSLYDLRNLFQINVEEGRHLWAMVYLLHRYFGRDGREEAEGLLERRSGDRDNPRILGADVSSNAAIFYSTGLKGRFDEGRIADDHMLENATYPVLEVVDGRLVERQVPALNALNERLRERYIKDTIAGVGRLNRVLQK